MNHIHRHKGYKPEMLADAPVRELITATCDTLTEPLHDIGLRQEVPPELTAAIDENTFYFSGFKTHHELVEASRLLKGDDGNFKPFEQFRRDVEAIDSTYNRNYLQAEYNFAAAASQMAVKWKEWEQDGDDYDLQYRTAGDDRVREEHAALDGITLPPSDPFWNSYLPPNGWNCRCTTVQVRKGKYPQSDPEEAAARGAACTARPKQQIFRFNPGKQQKIFPPKHPYFPKGCGNCQYKLADGKNTFTCAACKTLSTIKGKALQKATIKAIGKKVVSRNKVLMRDVPKHKALEINGDEFLTGKLLLIHNSIEQVYQHCNIKDYHFITWLLRFKTSSIKGCKYEGWAPNRFIQPGEKGYDPLDPSKRKHPEAHYFTYYSLTIKGKTYWVNVKMHKTFHGEVLYAIKDSKPDDLIPGLPYKK